jgi:glutamine synthetase
VYLLLAGLVVAARSGFEMNDALEFAAKTYVNVNIFQEEHKDKVKSMKLDSLPASCWDSAEMLERQREIYERHDVFPARIIDGIIKDLKKFDDKDIREEIKNNPEKMMEVVQKYYHCG